MIRQKDRGGSYVNNVTRLGPYYFSTDKVFNYPLGGFRQTIDEPYLEYGQPRPIASWGRPVLNPVVIQKVESSCNTVTVQTPSYWGMVEVTGKMALSDYRFGSLFDTTPVPINQHCEEMAIINALSKLSTPEVLDLGVGIAELKQTLQFLNDPLKSVRKLFSSFHKEVDFGYAKIKRRRKPTARDYAKTAADTWLGYRYAFKPLASDVTGIMIECSRRIDVESRKLRRASGRSKTYGQYETPFQPYNWSSNVELYWKGRVVHEVEQVVTAVQLYRYRPYFNDAIQLASLGLSPTQAASFLWEKTPFSFVADWAVNVGDWLRAWEPKPWIEYLGSCVSRKSTTKLQILDVEVMAWYTYSRCPVGTAKRVQLVREIKSLTPPLHPIFTDKMMSVSRFLDSLSLSWKPISNFCSKFRTRRK